MQNVAKATSMHQIRERGSCSLCLKKMQVLSLLTIAVDMMSTGPTHTNLEAAADEEAETADVGRLPSLLKPIPPPDFISLSLAMTTCASWIASCMLPVVQVGAGVAEHISSITSHITYNDDIIKSAGHIALVI
jgi:hypothetical protein